MTTEDFIKNVAHDLFSGGVTLTPIAEAKAIPCNIIPKPAQVIFNPPATIVYKEYIETHGLDSPPYEHFTACPMCGGNYVPYKRCDLCGNPIFDEYIMLKSGEVYCENCYCRKNIDDLWE